MEKDKNLWKKIIIGIILIIIIVVVIIIVSMGKKSDIENNSELHSDTNMMREPENTTKIQNPSSSEETKTLEEAQQEGIVPKEEGTQEQGIQEQGAPENVNQ